MRVFESSKVISIRCRKCFEFKPTFEMRTDKRQAHGKDKICHKCSNKQIYWDKRDQRLSEKKIIYHDNKEQHLAYNRDRRYKLSPGQYDKMLLSQNGVCAICDKPENRRSLSVDHCHKTGEVRGLLCDQCNMAIGKSKDSEVSILRALNYIIKNSLAYKPYLEN